MVDFSKLIPKEPRDCTECGASFRPIREEATLCLECQYYADHPEMAPKYWTWTQRAGQRWAATARWPDHEDVPSAGEQITVNRRDGSTSVETISNVIGARYDPSGNRIVTCDVERRRAARR